MFHNYKLTKRCISFSLKTNKSPGYDEVSFNVIKQYFGPLDKLLLHIFNLSIEKGIFHDDLKIASVTPIFKDGHEEDLGNYKPISFLSCFSKIFAKIMYNRIYKHLTMNDILYENQFDFQDGRSTEHAVT